MRKRILVVDGDVLSRATLVDLLTGLDCETVVARDGAEAIARLREEKFELCITDARLPGPDIPHLDGYSVLKEAKRRTPAVPVIMLRTEASLADAVAALRAGAANFLPKPFHATALTDVRISLFFIATTLMVALRQTLTLNPAA